MLEQGEDEQRVRDWLYIGAQTPGVIGFAVGRTVFWQPLVEYKNGPIRDCPDQTDSSNHVTLWDGSSYKRAA